MTAAVEPVVEDERQGWGGRSGPRGVAYGARREIEQLAAGHAAWCGAMIGKWGPLPERAPLLAALLVVVREVSFRVPGWSGGSRRGPG